MQVEIRKVEIRNAGGIKKCDVKQSRLAKYIIQIYENKLLKN